MKIDENKYLRFDLAVALSCCNPPELGSELDGKKAAAYIEEALRVLLSNTGISVHVAPLPYPQCSKIPLVITLNGAEQRLLWFYPQMSTADLTEELEGLVCDYVVPLLCIPA